MLPNYIRLSKDLVLFGKTQVYTKRRKITFITWWRKKLFTAETLKVSFAQNVSSLISASAERRIVC
jgi:hypothetical protein